MERKRKNLCIYIRKLKFTFFIVSQLNSVEFNLILKTFVEIEKIAKENCGIMCVYEKH